MMSVLSGSATYTASDFHKLNNNNENIKMQPGPEKEDGMTTINREEFFNKQYAKIPRLSFSDINSVNHFFLTYLPAKIHLSLSIQSFVPRNFFF